MNYRYEHVGNIIQISNKTSMRSRVIGYILLSAMICWLFFALTVSIFTKDIENLRPLAMLVFIAPACISLLLTYTETIFYLDRKFVIHRRTIVFTNKTTIPFHDITSLGSKLTYHNQGGLSDNRETRGLI